MTFEGLSHRLSLLIPQADGTIISTTDDGFAVSADCY
jgi:hypothetical protein